MLLVVRRGPVGHGPDRKDVRLRALRRRARHRELAKGIASGLPLGVTSSRADVMDWPPGAHASTFGGNPVACAAALATIRLLKDQYVADAAAIEEFLISGLRELQEKHEIIGDVRGKGLMLGVELVRNRKTKERAIEERNALVQAMFRQRSAHPRGREERHSPGAAARADQGSGRHLAPRPRRGAERGHASARGGRDDVASRRSLTTLAVVGDHFDVSRETR